MMIEEKGGVPRDHRVKDKPSRSDDFDAVDALEIGGIERADLGDTGLKCRRGELDIKDVRADDGGFGGLA